MKTRTLLLLSVGCGLLILLAGGLKLFQVASDRTEVPVLEVGEASIIGDMKVVVKSIADGPDGTRVLVSMTGVAGEPVVKDWRLLGDGKVLEPSGAQDGEYPSGEAAEICGRSSTVPDGPEPIECVIRFARVEAVQAVAYTRAGEQRQWAPPRRVAP